MSEAVREAGKQLATVSGHRGLELALGARPGRAGRCGRLPDVLALQVHASSGHKYSLKEALCDPAVASRLADTRAAGEVKALDDFYKMLQHEPDRACYGLRHVEKANEALAIDTLLISDELFRHQDVAARGRYVRLVDSVRERAGAVRIFSSLHVSGEQLSQLTGVAAVLRFPVPELSDQEDSSSEED